MSTTEDRISMHWGVQTSSVCVSVAAEHGGWVSRGEVLRADGVTERFSESSMDKDLSVAKLEEHSDIRSRNPAPRRVVEWP